MIQACRKDITTHMARIIQISRLPFLLILCSYAPCQDIQASIENEILCNISSLIDPHETVVVEDFHNLRQFAAHVEKFLNLVDSFLHPIFVCHVTSPPC